MKEEILDREPTNTPEENKEVKASDILGDESTYQNINPIVQIEVIDGIPTINFNNVDIMGVLGILEASKVVLIESTLGNVISKQKLLSMAQGFE